MNLRRSLWLVFALVSALHGAAADTNKMVLRAYPIQPAALETVTVKDADDAKNARGGGGGEFIGMEAGGALSRRSTPDLEFFFRELGVSFPPGSYIYYQEPLSRLVMYNTEANHLVLSEVLVPMCCWPTQVEIDASYVVFPLKDIDAIARKASRAAPTSKQVLELWTSGKGRLLGTQKVITRSGVNAQIVGADEVIYPTEFESTQPQFSKSGSPVLSPVTPGSFETREAGMLFNVTPTVGPDGRTIDLVIAPELSELAEWDKVTSTVTTREGTSDSMTLLQPRFHAFRTTTTLTLNSGETLAQGGTGMRKGDEYIYLFVTPTIIDADGRAMSGGTNAPMRGVEIPVSETDAKGVRP